MKGEKKQKEGEKKIKVKIKNKRMKKSKEENPLFRPIHTLEVLHSFSAGISNLVGILCCSYFDRQREIQSFTQDTISIENGECCASAI